MANPLDPSEREKAEKLRDEIHDFSEVVGKLAGTVVDNVNNVSKFSHRTRRIAIGLAISLAIDMGLTGYLWRTNGRLTESDRRIAAVQHATSTEALCPLYGLIVSGYHPELRAAGAARTEYIRDYGILLKGYRALGCLPAVPDPPVTPTPSIRPTPTPSAHG